MLLHRQAGAPQPVMPAGARLLYYGNDWGHGKWVFDTVAVDGAPLFTAADVASCTVKEHDYHDQSDGSDVVTQRPWLEVRFTDAGQHKLAELGSGQGVVIAFGDDALSLGWFPQWTESGWFPSGLPEPGREPRAAERARRRAARCVRGAAQGGGAALATAVRRSRASWPACSRNDRSRSRGTSRSPSAR